MSVAELNAKWGSTGTIDFFEGKGGFPAVRLSHPTGSTIDVYLYGAHITSWLVNDTERLFLSDRAEFTKGKAIRGGIPIVFPQFGNGPLPAHGFARNSLFDVYEANVSKAGPVLLSLILKDSEDTHRVWPHSFEAMVTFVLDEDLCIELCVKNTDTKPFEFQNLFHTYFLIPDISQISLRGLAGTTVVDFLQNNKELVESAGNKKIACFTDQLYRAAPDQVDILGPDGTVIFEVEKERMSDYVLWNPWVEKTAQMKDLSPESYKKFVCLEAGNVSNKISLKPGESFSTSHRLRAI